MLLRDTLGVPEEAIEKQRLAADGKPAKVFHFDAITNPGAAPSRRPATVPGTQAVRVPTAEHDWRLYPSKGPLTRTMEAAEGREPITLKALLVSGATRRNVRITSLGCTSLSLDMKGDLAGIGDTATVRFNVPLRRGVGLAAVTGKISKSATRPSEGVSLLEITIESLDEGDRPGVVERYVRWLHQRALGTTTDAGVEGTDAEGTGPEGTGPEGSFKA